MSDNDTQLDVQRENDRDTPATSEPYQDFGALDAAETVHTVDTDAAQDIADYNAEADAQDAEDAAEALDEDVTGEAPADPVEEYKRQLRLKDGDWYVVHSYAGYEKRVKTNLETRIQSLNMED